MSHGNLTRWIEDADARRFHDSAVFDRHLPIEEAQHLHLGTAIANLSCWLRRSVTRDALAAIGCRVLGPHGRSDHRH